MNRRLGWNTTFSYRGFLLEPFPVVVPTKGFEELEELRREITCALFLIQLRLWNSLKELYEDRRFSRNAVIFQALLYANVIISFALPTSSSDRM